MQRIGRRGKSSFEAAPRALPLLLTLKVCRRGWRQSCDAGICTASAGAGHVGEFDVRRRVATAARFGNDVAGGRVEIARHELAGRSTAIPRFDRLAA